MYNLYYKICFICLLTFAVHKSPAQLLDSLTLDTMQGHVSIQEALKNPDTVIKLVLRKQHLKTFPLEILQFKNLQYLLPRLLEYFTLQGYQLLALPPKK